VTEPAATPLIQLRGITKRYGTGAAELMALKGIDLDIHAGEFVAIMGPSGSGKSTAMNILGCLDTPTAGQYLFKGAHVEALTRDQRARLRRRFLGFVFQGFNLLARTSAQENVELPLLYRGDGASVRRVAAAEALQSVGLGGWEHHTPAELSGGQQQRVAIARAIVTAPAVVLADEPTGNLDTQRSHEIMGLLLALNRDHGITVLMVTHEPDMAAYARRMVTFVDGRIAKDVVNTSTPWWRPPSPRREHLMLYSVFMLALRSVRRNLLRSFLTILGIVIGVSAVITMVTLGNGATQAIKTQISSLGTNLLLVMPGQRGPGGGRWRRRWRAAVHRGRRRRHRQRRSAAWPPWRRRAAPASPWWPTAATGPPASPAAPTPGSPPATGSWPPAASLPTTNNWPARPCASSAKPCGAKSSAAPWAARAWANNCASSSSRVK
jgi:putative ABC transport system ATP-binding protein